MGEGAGPVAAGAGMMVMDDEVLCGANTAGSVYLILCTGNVLQCAWWVLGAPLKNVLGGAAGPPALLPKPTSTFRLALISPPCKKRREEPLRCSSQR